MSEYDRAFEIINLYQAKGIYADMQNWDLVLDGKTFCQISVPLLAAVQIEGIGITIKAHETRRQRQARRAWERAGIGAN